MIQHYDTYVKEQRNLFFCQKDDSQLMQQGEESNKIRRSGKS